MQWSRNKPSTTNLKDYKCKELGETNKDLQQNGGERHARCGVTDSMVSNMGKWKSIN